MTVEDSLSGCTSTQHWNPRGRSSPSSAIGAWPTRR